MVQKCHHCGQSHDAFAGCASPRVSRQPLEGGGLVGHVVADRYHVVEVIGAGSTGTVFGVEHVRFSRPAAMKVLRPMFAPVDVIARVFNGEARAAWSVRHPCLCEVFDLGTLPDGTPFFVMERLEGETLAARIGRAPLSLAAAIDVLMQTLSAIATIHARDLLLQDLRPQNLYLADRRGCRPLLKILDFGLARLTPFGQLQRKCANREANDASTAMALSLSPERAHGEHALDPASDLFLAAAIFYASLVGQPAFASSSWDGPLLQVAEGKPAELHERRSDVSHELSAFVSRCLSANPRLRPSSAKEMQDALRSIIEGARAGISSMPVSRARESSAFSSRTMPLSAGGPQEQSPCESCEPVMTRASRPDPRTYERSDVTSVMDSSHPTLMVDESIARPSPDRAPPLEIDEASAESEDRTVPPPPPIDVEIDVCFDDGSEVGSETRAGETTDDEETETMTLSPELRARVDQLMAMKPAPVPVVSVRKGATKPRR